MFYFVRKNFSFAIPMLNEEYGISNANFGFIMTLGGLIYGVSKFVNGILADRTNARWHLVAGLSVCAWLSSNAFDRLRTLGEIPKLSVTRSKTAL